MIARRNEDRAELHGWHLTWVVDSAHTLPCFIVHRYLFIVLQVDSPSRSSTTLCVGRARCDHVILFPARTCGDPQLLTSRRGQHVLSSLDRGEARPGCPS